MALINIAQSKLSDLVVHEEQPAIGYARRVINLSNTETDVTMGTVVYRTVSSGAVDQDAPYAVLSNANQLVATNEFAVVFGDKYGCKETFTTAAAGETPAVAFVRGDVILKDELLIDGTLVVRGAASHLALKTLLEKQGILMEVTYGA